MIVVAQFMVILDVAIVNVALPAMKDDLGFGQSGLEWVITAYAIVFGGFLLLGGRLADLLGRRRMFLIGVALFTLASALCGLAWSAGSLVAFRGVEGLAGALLAPAGLSLLMTTFAEGRERNLALGIWGGASGSGGAAGVLLGGALTSYLSWPWIFYLNLPVGVALLLVAPRVLSESRGHGRHAQFDVSGAVAGTAALMTFVYALTHAAQDGWSDRGTVELVLGAAALAVAFVVVERRAAAPLLPLRIFRIRTVAVANAVTVVISLIAFSEFFLLTLYMQQVLGWSALETGGAFTAIALTIAVVSNVAQKLVTRFGARTVLTVGLLLTTGSLGWLARLPVDAQYATDLLPAYLLNGVGLALCFIPATIAGLAGVNPADAGVASGLVNTSRQVGGAVGLAVVNTIAASSAGDGVGAAAAAHGFRVALGVVAVLALGGAVVAATLLGVRPAPSPEDEAVPEELVFEEAA